jgi:hypothetical protein
MNYQIVTDEQELIKFIDWLPELTHEETFYLCLFARSKYTRDLPETMNLPHIKTDKCQMKRFTSDKKRMIDKIRQLECPVGSYKQKDLIVPQEALALYITINPRSFVKANTASVRKLLDLALQPYNGFHPYQEVMSEIQKAKSRSVFVTFDFDVEKSVLMTFKIGTGLESCLNMNAVNIFETRGGYHVVIKTELIEDRFKKSWYNDVRYLLAELSEDHDNAGDIMLPVPGTYQGGFTPRLIS